MARFVERERKGGCRFDSLPFPVSKKEKADGEKERDTLGDVCTLDHARSSRNPQKDSSMTIEEEGSDAIALGS